MDRDERFVALSRLLAPHQRDWSQLAAVVEQRTQVEAELCRLTSYRLELDRQYHVLVSDVYQRLTTDLIQSRIADGGQDG